MWNSSPMTVDCDMDFGDPNERLTPIFLAGTRNGVLDERIPPIRMGASTLIVATEGGAWTHLAYVDNSW